MEIRAADPAEGDVDGDLASAGSRRRQVHDRQQPILSDLDRAHGAPSVSNHSLIAVSPARPCLTWLCTASRVPAVGEQRVSRDLELRSRSRAAS